MIALIAATMGAMMGSPSSVQTEQTDPPNQSREESGKPQIIVRPQKTESERREELREFTREIVRKPRRGQPIAKFFYPICPKVSGIAPADARAIEDRIRANAESFGLGANPDPDCVPTIRVGFMAPAAGPPDKWLSEDASALKHLPAYQRREVLSEEGPVRAWNKVTVRDFNGQSMGFAGGESWIVTSRIEPFSNSDPITTTEITGAAILIERKAAEGHSLAQLADYVTVRSLLGIAQPEKDAKAPASTILTLFTHRDAPEHLTNFDRALIEGLYQASRNSSARRVIKNVAANAVEKERAE